MMLAEMIEAERHRLWVEAGARRMAEWEMARAVSRALEWRVTWLPFVCVGGGGEMLLR